MVNGDHVSTRLTFRFPEGSSRGFLVLRSTNGSVLASGELRQMVNGDHVSTRLTFRFRDGSVDDEMTTYAQTPRLRLLIDHHIQRGPSYPHPMDMTVDAVRGIVTTHLRRDGRGSVERQHVDLPPDTSNGLVFQIIKNLDPKVDSVQIPVILGGSKPRLIKLSISLDGEDTFFVAGLPCKARRYVVKAELGPLTKIAAALTSKTPADMRIWVAEGDPPAMLQAEGQLYEGGPVWRVDVTGPVLPSPNRHARQESSKSGRPKAP
jgi:hypothetical protein